MNANHIDSGTPRPTLVLIGLVAALSILLPFSFWPTADGGNIAQASAPTIRDVPATATPDTRTISAKALTNHECNDDEWHFVINQITDEAHAPASITVNWANGASETVDMSAFTGHVAHYTTDSNLDSTVTSATTEIYSSWHGQFNLSHGPCGPGTTNTPAPTLTNTPLPPNTPTPTNTNSPVPSPTNTSQPTNTPVPPTNTPVATATPTSQNTATSLPTGTFTAVATATQASIGTRTATATATNTPLAPTPQETDTPTNTPQVVFTATPTQVAGGAPEASPTPVIVAPPAPAPAPATAVRAAPSAPSESLAPTVTRVSEALPLTGGPPAAAPASSEVLPSTGVSFDMLTLALMLIVVAAAVLGTGLYMRKRRA